MHDAQNYPAKDGNFKVRFLKILLIDLKITTYFLGRTSGQMLPMFYFTVDIDVRSPSLPRTGDQM